ncbi:MAG: flagellar basal body L-ring protein FlgH [Candidatus Accumulibacter sp.]|jgi:flagellar L-ring protein precursor FlgH|nr:flagellar basal body L-ring protein FlgH [Accumulibacter sp.]
MNRTFFLLAALLGSACTTVPPSNVHQPMTVRPREGAALSVSNGSIYRPGASRALFEDRRARYVGDTMTIVISETTSASSNSNTKTKRESSITASVPTIVGLPGKSFQGLQLEAGTGNNFDGGGSANARNVFTGNIAVTIIEVLPNGNLLVSGEKQVSIGTGTEYIRLSGVVNPYYISAANTISSANVADARIEYKESGIISEAQVMGWLSRFFLSVLPF